MEKHVIQVAWSRDTGTASEEVEQSQLDSSPPDTCLTYLVYLLFKELSLVNSSFNNELDIWTKQRIIKPNLAVQALGWETGMLMGSDKHAFMFF